MPYKPPIPLRGIAPDQLSGALRLQRALLASLASLARRNLPELSNAQFEDMGVADYRKEFGCAISHRHFRRLVSRTVERDAGASNWKDVALYLPDAVKQKKEADSFDPAEQFALVMAEINGCGDTSSLSRMEKGEILRQAFDAYDCLIGSGLSRKQAGRRLRAFLLKEASFLAPTRDAMLKLFNRKLTVYLQNRRDPKSLRDQRNANTGNHDGYSFPEGDADLLIIRTVWLCGGRIAEAWRALLAGNELSTATIDRYRGKGGPDHVPDLVMERVAPEIEAMMLLLRGKRAFDSWKGHITRRYDGIFSMDILQADDFTMPVYFYIEKDGGFAIVRGQVLLLNSFRTHRILGYSLGSNPNYTGFDIYNLHIRVFADHGLPKVLYWERGIWEKACILKGRPFSPTEVSGGLGDLGIQFVHAHRPRSKTIERIGESVQRLMEGEPGYCGRDERRDAPEALRKQMAAVQARREHPGKFFMSYDEWDVRLGELIEKYNATPQPGSRIIEGFSPDAAFAKFANETDPPARISPEVRQLFSSHKEVRQVTPGGITFQFGKRRFTYRPQNGEISHLIGRKVLTFFDPENYEQIVITDLDRKNPISVPIEQSPSAMECLVSPGAGEVGRANASVENMVSYQKTRFKVLQAKFPMPERRLIASPEAVEKSKAIEDCKEEAKIKSRVRQGIASAEDRWKAEGRAAPAGNFTPDELDAMRVATGRQELERREEKANEFLKQNALDYI